MKILLTGGGTGGHITPLLAVAHELKKLDPTIELYGVCERDAKFVHLYEADTAIAQVFQIPAGKLRRYGGESVLKRITDVRTMLLNTRDLSRTVRGFRQAKKMLKELQPDGIVIKGGFVGVPVGLAAASLKIPFITHDSDSVPGLANRIVARWAHKHATGMPAEFYTYPTDKTIFTGIPVTNQFVPVTSDLMAEYRTSTGLQGCEQVLTIIGGSQGAGQLNDDVISIVGRLMQQHPKLGIAHIVGASHEQYMIQQYKKELLADELRRVVVKGFVDDVYRYTGAADVVVSRASATVLAELAIQGKAVILVPGQLAGGHQYKNAKHLSDNNQAEMVPHSDAEGLYKAVTELLNNSQRRNEIKTNLATLAKPDAAKELAQLIIDSFNKGSGA